MASSHIPLFRALSSLIDGNKHSLKCSLGGCYYCGLLSINFLGYFGV